MQNRLPTRTPSTSIDCASGDAAGFASSSSKASLMPLRSRCARSALAVFSDAMRG
jgi:hypothetical protein